MTLDDDAPPTPEELEAAYEFCHEQQREQLRYIIGQIAFGFDINYGPRWRDNPQRAQEFVEAREMVTSDYWRTVARLQCEMNSQTMQ